jgi:hypothetical protein
VYQVVNGEWVLLSVGRVAQGEVEVEDAPADAAGPEADATDEAGGEDEDEAATEEADDAVAGDEDEVATLEATEES